MRAIGAGLQILGVLVMLVCLLVMLVCFAGMVWEGCHETCTTVCVPR